jgi:hypothetical protein
MFKDSKQFGMLFANPIPVEFAMPKDEIDTAINQAVQEAAEQGFHGHANTPFILSRIKELTHGTSLPANRALIKSNVAMAAKVAVELSKFGVLTSADPFPGAQKKYLDTFKKAIDVNWRRLDNLITALDASEVTGNAGNDKGDSATEALSAEGKSQNKSAPKIAVGSSFAATGSKWYNSEITSNYAARPCANFLSNTLCSLSSQTLWSMDLLLLISLATMNHSAQMLSLRRKTCQYRLRCIHQILLR